MPMILLSLVANIGDGYEIRQTSKEQTKISRFGGKSTTVHTFLFCAHKLCMNNVTKAFPLVSSSVGSKQLLCFVHGQGQKSDQKHTTKNFVGFHNNSPLLTTLQVVDMQTKVKILILLKQEENRAED